jgi:GH25 family lysozyme M1 (1,4-beta-N-acetylmuramidase)
MDPQVLKQQQHLVELGFSEKGPNGPRPLTCDGELGPNTQNAINQARSYWGDNWELPVIQGIDVAQCQGDIDWTVVESSNQVQFAYIRATIGVGDLDDNFRTNWEAVKGLATLFVGPYHVFSWRTDPAQQANDFAASVGSLADLGTRVLAPMIDVEMGLDKNGHPLIPGQEYAANLLVVVNEIKNRLGRRPIIYTGGVFDTLTQGADSSIIDSLTQCELWHSAYVCNPHDFTPRAWTSRGKSFRIWQKSGDVAAGGAKGWTTPGIPKVVDRDILIGKKSVADWAAQN